MQCIGKGVAEALNYIHTHGFLHCDLKPSNVLFDDHGKTKLTGLGLSRKSEAVAEHQKSSANDSLASVPSCGEGARTFSLISRFEDSTGVCTHRILCTLCSGKDQQVH